MTLVFGAINFGLREILRRYLIKSQPLTEVLLVGKGGDAEELCRYIGDNHQLGYRIESWIKEYDIHAIDKALNESEAQVIVVPSQLKGDKYFANKIYERLIKGTEVVSFSDFYENILGKVSMDELKENWYVEKFKPKDGLYNLLKRLNDVFLALFVLVVTITFWPLIALIIKMVSPGPVMFLRERVGAGGRKFLLYKFRTMHDGHEEKTQVKENFAEERGDQRRIFGFGKVMRKMRIDEWPQVINVLRGELSFVGPRVDFADYYELLKEKIPYYQIRTIIIPGLSGWAQIHDKVGNSVETARERLAYDIYYIKNRSLLLDLAISLKTLKTVLTLTGT
ncbi:MAG: sugar transferase [Patescibacteria group bacterium]